MAEQGEKIEASKQNLTMKIAAWRKDLAQKGSRLIQKFSAGKEK